MKPGGSTVASVWTPVVTTKTRLDKWEKSRKECTDGKGRKNRDEEPLENWNRNKRIFSAKKRVSGLEIKE